jgi:hypothetical protein
MLLPLLLCSEHAIRRDRPAVVLGSEVGALGRYERVPLGEESDSCKKEPPPVSKPRILYPDVVGDSGIGGVVRTPHEPAAPGREDERRAPDTAIERC